DAVLTVGVLNQSRAIEPFVRRPAPDVRRAEGFDGGLDHVPRVAAERRGRRRRWELGRTTVPASLPSPPLTPPPSPSPRPPAPDAPARARVPAPIPDSSRPATS